MSVNKLVDESAKAIMDMAENKYILFQDGIAYCENRIYIIEDIDSGCITLVKANSVKDAKIKYRKMKLNS